MKKGGKELDRDDKFDSDYIWPEGEILFYSLYLLASKTLCSAHFIQKKMYKRLTLQNGKCIIRGGAAVCVASG